MGTRKILGAALAWALGATVLGAAETTTPSSTAFGWLKGLSGKWHGKAEWSGERKGSYELEAVYSATGNGTAVVENLISNGVTMMTSVYHADGQDLRMTHYCGAGNQPRLKSTEIELAKKMVHFKMIDMTGRQGPHVGEAEVRVVDEDHATIFFTFVDGKAPSLERIDLTRDRP